MVIFIVGAAVVACAIFALWFWVVSTSEPRSAALTWGFSSLLGGNGKDRLGALPGELSRIRHISVALADLSAATARRAPEKGAEAEHDDGVQSGAEVVEGSFLTPHDDEEHR